MEEGRVSKGLFISLIEKLLKKHFYLYMGVYVCTCACPCTCRLVNLGHQACQQSP